MSNESLQEELNVPMLGGILIAECYISREDVEKRADEALIEMGVPDARSLHRMSKLGMFFGKPTKEQEDISRKVEELLQKFSDPLLIENYRFDWRIAFWISLSDRRYNSATVSFSEERLSTLIQDFVAVQSIIQQLQSVKLSGTYHKSIRESGDHKIEVIGANGALKLQFSISNEHRWLFTSLSQNQIKEAIRKLKQAQQRGPELLNTLRTVKSLSAQ